MDEETRGLIEKALDEMISDTDMTDRIRWVLREIAVHSPEDFALGYVIGSLTSYAYRVAWRRKLFKKLDERLERSLGKERVREIERELEERKERYEPPKVYLTKKEETEVRNMLRRRLVDMRRKVSRDFHR